jgi:hypothetical protein
MGPGRDRHTIKGPISGDLTQLGDALLVFRSRFQELAGRFLKRSHVTVKLELPFHGSDPLRR